MRSQIGRIERGVANGVVTTFDFDLDGQDNVTVFVENFDQKAGINMRTGGDAAGSNAAATRAVTQATHGSKNGCLRFDAVTAGAAGGGGDIAVASALQVDATPGPDVFVDETTDINSAGANDVSPFPATENVNDYFAIGSATRFSSFKINTGTGGTVGTVAWEYWNGTTWTALSGVTDGTNGFTTTGLQTVSFTNPTDWVARALNGGATLYYVRARVTVVYTVNPLITQGFIVSVGGNSMTLEITAAASQAFSIVESAPGVFKLNLACNAAGIPTMTANAVIKAIANDLTPGGVSFRSRINVTTADGSDGSALMELKAGSTTNVMSATSFAGGVAAAALAASGHSVTLALSAGGPYGTNQAGTEYNSLAQNAGAQTILVDKVARAIRITITAGGTGTYLVCGIVAPIGG